MQDPRQPWQQPTQTYNQQPQQQRQSPQSQQAPQSQQPPQSQQAPQSQQPPQWQGRQRTQQPLQQTPPQQAPPGQQAPQQAQRPQQQAAQPPGSSMARSQLRTVSVEQIVQTDLVTVPATATVATISQTMASEEVGSVVVVDDGAPLGIITDRDLALALAEGTDVAGRQAGQFVDGTLQTGSTEMSVFDALERMQSAGIRRLPIVDENNAIRGIVALDDVLVLLGEKLQAATEIIRIQSPRL